MGKFDKYLFRCSALGHLMSEPMGKTNLELYQNAVTKSIQLKSELDILPKLTTKGDPSKAWANKKSSVDKQTSLVNDLIKIKDDVQLSDGAKTHLTDIWISETKRRKADINNKFIEKGLAMEEDGITLYSRVKKIYFRKNETSLLNGFIKGTPDLFTGNSIHEADRIPDIKCSWSANTFYRTFTKKMNELYYWQGTGYMWLTGAKHFDLVYCLVNAPEPLIEAEKRSLWYKLGQPADDNSNWIDAQAAIDRNMMYDDIPLRKRVLEYSIDRNEADIELLKRKVIAAREYLNWLDNEFELKFAG